MCSTSMEPVINEMSARYTLLLEKHLADKEKFETKLEGYQSRIDRMQQEYNAEIGKFSFNFSLQSN